MPMFSSDQNIERIADLIEEVKRWLELKTSYTRLKLVDKVVRIITALVLVVVLFLIFMMALIYLSFASAIALGDIIGSIPVGLTIVSAVYVVLFFLIISLRHVLIEKPLVKFLISVLADGIDENPSGKEVAS